MRKYIKMLMIGILLIVGMNSCSTLGPPPDGTSVVYYYDYPGHYYYRPAPPPRYYRPIPPPPRPKPNIPPARPNNGNKRHR